MHRWCSDWRARYRTQKTGRRMKYSSVPTSTSPFYFLYIYFYSPKQKSQGTFLCPSHYNSNAAVVHESSSLVHLVQQNEQPPLWFFTIIQKTKTEKELIFKGTDPEANGSFSGSLPKYLLTHKQFVSVFVA